MELPKIQRNEDEDVLAAITRESTSSSQKVVAKAKKSLINYGGLMIGGLIIVIMTAVMTTDIKINSFLDLASLGLDWFILYFCGYAMYVSWSDSGMRAGMKVKDYTDIICKHKNLCEKVKETRSMQYAQQYCDDYIRKELKATRESILSEIGVSYEDYIDKYMKYGEKEIKAMKLPKRVEETLIRTNKTKPVELTPPMFTKLGRVTNARSPLGTDPHIKKRKDYIIRLGRTAVTSALMTSIVADVVVEFSWALLALVCVKVAFVIFTGFMGYSYGYENIVTDTVNYVTDQSTLLEGLLQYVEEKNNESIRSDITSQSVEAEHTDG